MARRMLAPIISVKHYVQFQNTQIPSTSVTNLNLAEAEVAPAVANADEVTIGSVVKALYIEMWCLSEGASGSTTQFLINLEKRPADATPITHAQMLALNGYPNKKNILYHTQGVLSGKDTGSVNLIRTWFKIPKGKQRMGQGDTLVLNMSILGNACRLCGFSTYKEFQ